MKKLTLILILLTSLNGFGQKTIDDQFNGWITYSGSHKITNKLSWFSLYSVRRSDFLKRWQQSLLRNGISYNFTKNANGTLGYDWVITYPYGKQPIAVQSTEHRIFEQFILKNKAGRVYFKHRYRFEQRFFENASLNNNNQKEVNGYRFRQRARYRFIVSIPLNHKEMTDNTFFFSAFNEIFINFGKGTNNDHLDQDWMSAMFGYKLANGLTFKLGYMNQFILKSDGIRAERNHTVTLSANYGLDFRKKTY